MFDKVKKIRCNHIKLKRLKLLKINNSRLRNNFGIKIQTKLIISFLLLSLIPTLIVGMFSYYKLSNAIKSKTMKYSQQILDKTSNNIQSNINDINLICDEILLLESVQYGLINYDKIDIMEKREVIEDITHYFTRRFQLLKYLTEVEIITNNDEVLYTSGYCSFSKVEFEVITKRADELDGMIGWSNVKLRGRDNILIYKQLKSEKTKKGIGYLIIALDERLFSNTYIDINLGDNSDVFIIDSTGNVVSSVSREIKIGEAYKQKKIVDKIFAQNEDSENTVSIIMGETKYLIPNSILNDKRWALVSTIPYSNFNKESHDIMVNIILVSMTCIFFVILLSILISKSIWGPLNKLVNHMKDVKRGKFDIEIDSKGKDEISYLTMNFKKMVVQIEKLISEVKREQKEKREIEIQMLQAQINPHFLFNTLNSLKWTAKISQVDSVSKGLGALAEILRNTILDKNELISINEELKNINNYVVIQKLRYGNSFDIEYDIDEEVIDYKILKFLLQPIIENSMIHGQNNIEYILHIKLSCFVKDNKINIFIKDNGCGLDEEKVKRYLESDKKNKEKISSIGIYNVKERIKLNFGEEYGLQIEGKKGFGTTVTIVIPIID